MELSLSFGQDKDQSETQETTDPSTSASTPSSSHDTTGGGQDNIKWVTVEKTMGLLPAQIMAGRLEAEGIPARAIQEGAGRALGLTVGILGEGRVLVPEEFATQATSLLQQIAQEPIEWEETD